MWVEMAGSIYQDIILDKDGQVKCELCNTFIRDIDYLIEDHINNTNHAKAHWNRLLIRNGVTVSEKTHGSPATVANIAECSICNCNFDIKTLLDHMASNYHTKNIASIKEVVERDGGFMVLPENVNKFGCAVNCMICNCAVKFNLKEVMLHIESDKHMMIRSIAVQPLNAIFTVEDSDEYLWCKICQIYFQNYVELILQHVDKDTNHLREKRNLLNLIKDNNICIEDFLQDPKEVSANCKRCEKKIPCNLDNLERHIKGKQHNLICKTN